VFAQQFAGRGVDDPDVERVPLHGTLRPIQIATPTPIQPQLDQIPMRFARPGARCRRRLPWPSRT
jgi:hypothetical protein